MGILSKLEKLGPTLIVLLGFESWTGVLKMVSQEITRNLCKYSNNFGSWGSKKITKKNK